LSIIMIIINIFIVCFVYSFLMFVIDVL